MTMYPKTHRWLPCGALHCAAQSSVWQSDIRIAPDRCATGGQGRARWGNFQMTTHGAKDARLPQQTAAMQSLHANAPDIHRAATQPAIDFLNAYLPDGLPAIGRDLVVDAEPKQRHRPSAESHWSWLTPDHAEMMQQTSPTTDTPNVFPGFGTPWRPVQSLFCTHKAVDSLKPVV